MRTRTDRTISFEFSPPRSERAAIKLNRTWQRLSGLAPDFFSVTYGAGGSTRDGTFHAVEEMSRGDVEVAPHISFGSNPSELALGLLEAYMDLGVRRLVVLRGDVPSGVGSHESFPYANELVAYIRKETGDYFHIEVAAYPEVHPESVTADSDLDFFKMKVDAGANSAITQFFFNADAYFNFVDRCRSRGIEIPIVPGVIPIVNYQNLVRFSDKCGAEIPRWIRKQMESYGDDLESVQALGEEVVTRLCETLLDGGAPGLHFYTLNQALPSMKIWSNLHLATESPHG